MSNVEITELWLKANGYPVLSVSEPSDVEDGEIKITEMVHIQCGYDYICVVRETPDEEFSFSPMLLDTAQLKAHLERALQQEEAAAEVDMEVTYNV